MTTISNSADILDSRDIIREIEDLEAQLEDADLSAEEREEIEDALKPLQELADEASASPDWEYGEALIRDSYFIEYAQQLAKDIGAIDFRATWPLPCIDWDAAAEDLQADYSPVDFDGITYWIRA